MTPYDNVVTIMHEGASGGGKSEMLEHAHREEDARLLLGVNTVTGERRRGGFCKSIRSRKSAKPATTQARKS